MRSAAIALALALVAAPAFAAGHGGHPPPKPASEQPVSVHGTKEVLPKNSPLRVEESHLKPNYEKNAYEKSLNAAQKGYKEALKGKVRGLHHPPGELDLTSAQGEASKGQAAAVLQGEASAPGAPSGEGRQGGTAQGGVALPAGGGSRR
jgi:hypothetical protein